MVACDSASVFEGSGGTGFSNPNGCVPRSASRAPNCGSLASMPVGTVSKGNAASRAAVDKQHKLTPSRAPPPRKSKQRSAPSPAGRTGQASHHPKWPPVAVTATTNSDSRRACSRRRRPPSYCTGRWGRPPRSLSTEARRYPDALVATRPRSPLVDAREAEQGAVSASSTALV